MATSFWFDKKAYPGAANGELALALQGLAGQLDTSVTKSLHDMYPNKVHRNLLMGPEYALFMRGTIEELQKTLQTSSDKGMERISATKGHLAVWAVRLPNGNKPPEIIVCLAARGLGREYYWTMGPGSSAAQYGPPASTKMSKVKSKLEGNPRAGRIYNGTQITVYLYAAPEEVDDVTYWFAKVMKEVSKALTEKAVRGGEKPDSDLWVRDSYLSYRRDLNDLVDPKKLQDARRDAIAQKLNEEEYIEKAYIADTMPDYPKHKALMQERPLWKELIR